MPTAYGTHPYFAVNEESKKDFGINGVSMERFNPQTANWAEELDIAVENPGVVTIRIPEKNDIPGREIAITSDPEKFQSLYVWSLPGKNFVCIEPWTRPENALNKPDQTLWVPPEKSVSLPISISAKIRHA